MLAFGRTLIYVVEIEIEIETDATGDVWEHLDVNMTVYNSSPEDATR